MPRVFPAVWNKIAEVNVAHVGVLIPAKHRVDCFGQLCAAALVYVAGVYLDEGNIFLTRKATGLADLPLAL